MAAVAAGGVGLTATPRRRSARQTPDRNRASPSSPPAQLTGIGRPGPIRGAARTARSARARCASETTRRAVRFAPVCPAQDRRRERRDARHRVRRGDDRADAGRRHRAGAEPGAADRERRAVVADQGTEAAGAREASAAIAAERDGAGAREQQHARGASERAQVGGLDVGDHHHAASESTQSARERAALAGRPDSARGHAERGDVTTREAPATPEAVQHRGQSRHARRRCPEGPAPGSRRDHPDPRAAEIHHDDGPAGSARCKTAIHGSYCPPAGIENESTVSWEYTPAERRPIGQQRDSWRP